MLLNRRFLSTRVLAALIMAAPAVLTAAGADTSSKPAAARIQIANFGRVNATYYRGEQPEGRDYADLAALGVKTVIDLQGDGTNYDEGRLVEKAGMKFVRIPMTTHASPTADQLAQFLQIVNDPAQQPVYVHCKGGRHRTGVMTAVYRMESDGWTAAKAFQEMKDYKFGADFLHPEFKQFVFAYKPHLEFAAPKEALVAVNVAG